MGKRPWRWRHRSDRYNRGMTTLMSAALPASASVHAQPSFETATRLPAGLTEADAARITAAISAARTEATRTVYANVWSQWERWCATRGIAALPGGKSVV